MPLISCPSCSVRHEYNTQSPYRPFCSERCQLIDLGAWSQETYKIPVQSSDDLDEE
ncbi:DNA gyrase inhibitor YacG [Formosimonas limnophila]|uniref:DNA gyrase inhibitor YacG n=1 Tax=Formosimonas limnophila TaxID=1384487 RepID=UPI0016771DB6|nr:DNA gyrase inhibitor YacG [Formosimonas limnophila]